MKHTRILLTSLATIFTASLLNAAGVATSEAELRDITTSYESTDIANLYCYVKENADGTGYVDYKVFPLIMM